MRMEGEAGEPHASGRLREGRHAIASVAAPEADRPVLPLDASNRPSEEKAMQVTGPVWPSSVRSSWPLASHSLTVLSPLPLASVRPVGQTRR